MARGSKEDDERTAAAKGAAGHAAVRFIGATLEVTAGPSAGLRARVESPSFIVGSAEAADLRIADHTVSREHLRLSLDESGLRVKDDKSRNGTWLGGARIANAVLTKDASLMLGGATTISIRLDAGQSTLRVSTRTEFGGAIGVSAAMRHVFAFLERAAQSDVPLLLEGDSGVGKDILARAVHAESKRSPEPFVWADCGAIAPEHIEAELFGFVRPGEMLAQPGLVAQASVGTLFLDEVDQLPLEMQPKILRMLDTREIFPVGGRGRGEIVNARVIAASDRRLAEATLAKEFRKDLEQRLGVARVVVPPLRDRSEDIEPLARSFLRTATGDPNLEVPTDLGALLTTYAWPGNVRELRNVIERYALLGGSSDRGALFGGEAIVNAASSTSGGGGPHGHRQDLTMLPWHEARQQALSAFEHTYVKEVLERSGGVVARAAQHAGIARPSFYRMIERQRLTSSNNDDADDE